MGWSWMRSLAMTLTLYEEFMDNYEGGGDDATAHHLDVYIVGLLLHQNVH
jgi:hypothetical protein